MEKSELEGRSNVQAASTTTEDDHAAPNFSRLVTSLTVLGVVIASFEFALDNTITAVVQSRLVDRFGEIQKLPWISVAYQLGSTSVNPLWGRTLQNFNHKHSFLTAFLLFNIGSAVCGSAPSMNAFIVGRVIAGLGGNGVYQSAMCILSDMSSIGDRAVYLSCYALTWCLGTLLGPIIGGALTSSSYNGWRWCFYLNLLIGAIGSPVYIFTIPSFPQARGRTIIERLQLIDYCGMILWIGASVSGVIALSFGGITYSWSSGNIIAPLCISGVLLIAFILQQRYSVLVKQENRALPVHLLVSGENCLFFVLTSIYQGALFVPVYYIPLYFEFVHNKSALSAGIHLLPYVCVAMFFVLLNGATMFKLRYYTPWFIGGSALLVVGSALMSTVSAGMPTSTIYGFSVLLAAGGSAPQQAAFPVVQAHSPSSELSNVVALLTFGQRVGITGTFAIANTIFLNRATTMIARLLPNFPRVNIQGAIAAGNAAIFSQLLPGEKQGVLEAVSSAFDKVYYEILAGAALCLVLSLFLKHNNPLGPTKSQNAESQDAETQSVDRGE